MDAAPSLALSHVAALIIAVDMLGSGSDVEREIDALRRNVSEIVSMLDASKRPSEDGTPEEIDIRVIREPLLRIEWTHDSDDINLKPWD
jgi:hypothetical protein